MSQDQQQGRVAVITGASSGIGAATARSLHAAGYRVALLARRKAQPTTSSTASLRPAQTAVPEVRAQCIRLALESIGPTWPSPARVRPFKGSEHFDRPIKSARTSIVHHMNRSQS